MTLTVQEAAGLLEVSRSTTYEWMRQGRLPYLQVGRARRIEIQAMRRLLQEQRVEPLSQLGHGTRYAYEMGCRCDLCRNVWNEYHRAARNRRAERLDVVADRLQHGAISTYRNHGCRCAPCVEAQAQANRRLSRRAARA